MHENTVKDIHFYSQRYSTPSVLQTQLKTHHNHLLNNSHIKCMMGLTIKAHISSPRLHTHTPSQIRKLDVITEACFGTCQDCGVKDITLQPTRLVLCEIKTDRVSNSAAAHLQK